MLLKNIYIKSSYRFQNYRREVWNQSNEPKIVVSIILDVVTAVVTIIIIIVIIIGFMSGIMD